MSPLDDIDLLAKVTALEANCENNLSYLKAVDANAKKNANDIDVINEKRKPNLGLMCSFAGIVILFVASLWGISISPVKDKISDLKSTQFTASERFMEHTSDGHPNSIVSIIELNQKALTDQLSDVKSRLNIIEGLLRKQKNR